MSARTPSSVASACRANKERSTAPPLIQQAPLAQRYRAAGQHIGDAGGAPAEVGQAVLKGQTIAPPDGTVSAALHALRDRGPIGARPFIRIASGLPAPGHRHRQRRPERWTEL
nr:hypothetical protein [Pseudomonas aeruginosa]